MSATGAVGEKIGLAVTLGVPAVAAAATAAPAAYAWGLANAAAITQATAVIGAGATGANLTLATAWGAGSYTVYRGIDSAGVVKYIGITSRNVVARWAEHIRAVGTGRDLLRYEVIPGFTNLSRTGARVGEQAWINHHGGPNAILLNKRNEIAPWRWSLFGL